jgi:hypothetical protein
MRTRRLGLCLVLAVALTGTVPAGAGPRGRVEEQRYKGGTYGGQNVAATCPAPSFNWSDCYLVFNARKGERSFRVEVFDDVTPAAMIRVYVDNEGNGMTDYSVDVCSASDRIRIKPYARIAVIVWAHPYNDPRGDDSCVGNSTSGTVRMTFFR